MTALSWIAMEIAPDDPSLTAVAEMVFADRKIPHRLGEQLVREVCMAQSPEYAADALSVVYTYAEEAMDKAWAIYEIVAKIHGRSAQSPVYPRYIAYRADGVEEPGKILVLPLHRKAAQVAARVYAEEIAEEFPAFAQELLGYLDTWD